MTGYLKDCGTYPVSKDVFIRLRIESAIRGKHSLRSLLGIGSKIQVDVLET